MSQDHRDKIRNSNILSVLIRHVEGDEEISPARVTAALGLLKKIMPDLAAVDHAGTLNHVISHESALDELG